MQETEHHHLAEESGSVLDPVCAILEEAVRQSGRARQEISMRSAIHKDALRRILGGTRSPSLKEALAILDAAGSQASTSLILCLVGDHAHGREWMGEPVEEFIEAFLSELPVALERLLGNQIQEIRPRWAKGAAHRVARLISDHLEDIDRRDQHVFTR
jgi:hypothetical protein